MKCHDCGTQLVREKDTLVCTVCGYSKPAPVLFELTGGQRDPEQLRLSVERAATRMETDRLENRCACGCGVRLEKRGHRTFRFIRGHNLENISENLEMSAANA